MRDLARHGDQIALICGGESVTYAQLAVRVEVAANRLGQTRSLVQLAAGNDIESVIAYLAALRGGHPLLVTPDETLDVTEALTTAYDTDVVIADGSYRRRRDGSAHTLHPDLALLLSTSGSTGSPKLVRLSAANVQANAESIAEYLRITPEDRTITTLPMHYCYGLSVLHSYLLRGAAVVLSDRSVTDPEFWRLVRAERVTALAGVPYTFDLFERIGFADLELPHLRYVTQAGGRMSPARVRGYAELGQRRGWDLYVMYGQTEATARMAYLPPELAMVAPDAIGVAIPGGQLRVEPAADSAESPGELVYTGPNVMMGYALTPADLARGAELSELRTGDLATVGEDGLIRITGRRSRFAKVFGLRIDLQRVESALGDVLLGDVLLGDVPLGEETSRDVAPGAGVACIGGDEELAVIVERPTSAARLKPFTASAERVENCTEPGENSCGSPHAQGGPSPAGGREPTARALRTSQALTSAAARAAGLPESAVRVLEVDALPRTTSGKLDYGAMARLVALTPEARPTDDPGAALDLAGLKALYSSVLGVREVRDTDTFVGLGGDSLSYVRMSLRLEKALGRLPQDWQNTAVGEFGPPPSNHGSAGRRRWLRTIEMSVLLRAVAILLVLTSHIGVFVLYGGAHVLMAVAGFNFARFPLSRSRTAPPTRPLLVSAARIAAPAVVWIGAAAWWTGNYGLDSALLVRQLFGPDSYRGEWWFNWQYWFLEAIVYILLGLAALFACRRVDALERARPLVLPSVLVAVGLAVRYPIAAHSDGPGFMFLAPAVLWLFALGWLIARCETPRHRLAVTVLVLLAVPGFFTTTERDMVLLAGLLLLLWIPSVRLPGLINRAAGLLAGGSLYIYLTQFQVYPEFAVRTWLPVLACIAVGLAFWQVVEQAERGLRLVVSRLRGGGRGRPGSCPTAAAEGSRRGR